MTSTGFVPNPLYLPLAGVRSTLVKKLGKLCLKKPKLKQFPIKQTLISNIQTRFRKFSQNKTKNLLQIRKPHQFVEKLSCSLFPRSNRKIVYKHTMMSLCVSDLFRTSAYANISTFLCVFGMLMSTPGIVTQQIKQVVATVGGEVGMCKEINRR